MELSCAEVPLYGQVTVCAKFDKNIYLPEDAEFYFIYDGSTHRHIMFAERLSDNTLRSIAPGHGSQETVSVTVCMFTMGYSPVTVGCGAVTYAQDTASMLSNYLLGQAGVLMSDSHCAVRDQFGLTEENLRSLDHRLMLAMSHTDLPMPWSVREKNSDGEPIPQESLLHLSMRWGLEKLSRFLVSLPGGTSALTLSNGDGETPLDLAAHNGHTRLADLFANFQEVPGSDFATARLGDSAFLRFEEPSGVLSLTFNHTSEHTLEDDIKLFRKCFWDKTFRNKVLKLNTAEKEVLKMHSYVADTEEDSTNLISRGSSSENEDVESCQEPFLQLSENENQTGPATEKNPTSSDVLKKCKHQTTILAAASLSALINGHDEVYTNYMVVSQDTGHIRNEHVAQQQAPAGNGDGSDLTASTPQHPPFRARTYKFERSPAYSSIKKRSASLDGLDADSEDEGNMNRTHSNFCPVTVNTHPAMASSGDELDSFETNTDLDYTINRADSNSLLLKESLVSGIRLRSYSCSSPKPFLGKARHVRDVAASDSSEEQRAYSLPEQIKQKRIEEEEWDKYMTPAKGESEKYKVSRTLSFLKSRMSSTRNKSKTKNKDGKDKEKTNRHQFVAGTYAGVTPCLVCEKALLGKEALQCSQCSANVHKNCKDSAPMCTKQKSKEKVQPKARPPTNATSPSFSEAPQLVAASSMSSSTSLPISLSGIRQETALQVSKSVPVAITERRFLEPEVDPYTSRSRSQSEELLQVVGTPPSVDTFPIEDDVDGPLLGDLIIDPLEYEADSWSLIVDPSFCNKQDKDVIKRQDVIFELMQTELHHIQTLFIMSKIFRKGMKEELQLDHSTVDKIFPCLDELLGIHRDFFNNMRERRQESFQEDDRNFVINRIGDILVQQFSEENAETMKQIYGEFCSHHKEAVNIFKELQQNKKFQNFIRVRNSNLLARRRGIPECILLVTQRITKYPVLVERILRYTKEGTEEHRDLCKALCLIKNMIAAVDLRVNEYEKEQKLGEILNRIENKTSTKLKNGNAFRKQDLTHKERTLVHEGVVYWKTATGRLKDISALLLNDVLLFLQEKDQKFIFAAVDQKPPVISLQKLIVREVANEERGMFLISASSAGPEMYEIHTNSKEERNTWMRHIQEAVQSCPEEEEGSKCESDEDKRVAEARTAKIQRFQESLSCQDQQICGFLEEKLHIYAELAEMSAGEDVHLEPHLLVKPDPGEIPQATTLLNAALREAENLHVAVTSHMDSVTSLLEESSETSISPHRLTSFESGDEILESSSESLAAEVKDSDTCDSDLSVNQIQTDMEESYIVDKVDCTQPGVTQAEIVQAIQNLTCLLYSIQAAVTIQDSHIELQKVLLHERERTRGLASRGIVLQDQEKYRSLEKHREEAANFHKLQHQFNQEQQRWYRECDQRQREQEQKESVLQEREKECQSQEELLQRRREEFSHQLQDYQQNLERLREGQRLVEKEKEKLTVQQKLLRHYKHTRQSSLPVISLPSNSECTSHSRTCSLRSEDSLYIDDALARLSLNSLSSRSPPLAYPCLVNEDAASKNELARTNTRQSDFSRNNSHFAANTKEHWSSRSLCAPPAEHPSHLHKGSNAYKNDLNALQVIFRGAILAGTYSQSSGSSQPQHATEALPSSPSVIAQEEENATVEENIVYL